MLIPGLQQSRQTCHVPQAPATGPNFARPSQKNPTAVAYVAYLIFLRPSGTFRAPEGTDFTCLGLTFPEWG